MTDTNRKDTVQVTMSRAARAKLWAIKHHMAKGKYPAPTWDWVVDKLDEMYQRQGERRKGGKDNDK